MCDKALCDTFTGTEGKDDKYKSNWGSLLDYVDMSTSANITEIMASTLGKVSDKSINNSTSNKKLTVKPSNIQ